MKKRTKKPTSQFNILLEDETKERLESLSIRTDYTVTAIVKFLMTNNKSIDDLETIVDWDEDDGINLSALIKGGFIII